MSGKKETITVDRLSELPDPILIHILSYLPTKQAVQTVLIRRFSNLWTYLPNLNFDDSDFVEFWENNTDAESNLNHGFIQFVHNVLKFHQRPTIDKFRVYIFTMFNSAVQDENMGHELDLWLAFALRKQVKVLEFGFGMVEPDELLYKLPKKDFVSDSLVELKLIYIDFDCLRRMQMSLLTVLKLEWVNLNDDVCREIIRGCPLLKDMEIYNCWGLTLLESPTLEKFKLVREMPFLDLLKINCPKLSTLNFTGCMDCVQFANLSSIDDVTFDLLSRNSSFISTDQGRIYG